jgi:hypothetical protein
VWKENRSRYLTTDCWGYMQWILCPSSLYAVTLSHFRLVKYLGVILDSQLTSREHVDAKMRKADNLLWACRRAYGGKWGLRPMVVHWLYVIIIRQSVSFASLVWWPGCQMASAKKWLSRVQRLACLGITGAIHTTPIWYGGRCYEASL